MAYQLSRVSGFRSSPDMVLKKVNGLMHPHYGIPQLMIMKGDWAVENNISKHKWSSDQQSANDK